MKRWRPARRSPPLFICEASKTVTSTVSPPAAQSHKLPLTVIPTKCNTSLPSAHHGVISINCGITSTIHSQSLTSLLCGTVSSSILIQLQRATFIEDMLHPTETITPTTTTFAAAIPLSSVNDDGTSDEAIDGEMDQIFGMMEYDDKRTSTNTISSSTSNTDKPFHVLGHREINQTHSDSIGTTQESSMYASQQAILKGDDSFSSLNMKVNSPSAAQQTRATSKMELAQEVDNIIRRAKIATGQPVNDESSGENQWQEDDDFTSSSTINRGIEVIKEDDEAANQPSLVEDSKQRRIEGIMASDRSKAPPAPVRAWTCNVSVLDAFQRPVNYQNATVEGAFDKFTELDKVLPRSFAESFASGRNKRKINDEPTSLQRATIPAILQGRDVCVVGPTGSGKTLAYAIPVLAEVVRSLESDTNTGYALEKLVSQKISNGEICRVCELDVSANLMCPMTGLPHRRAYPSGNSMSLYDDETTEKIKRIRYMKELRSTTQPSAIVFAPTGLLVYQLYGQFKNYAPMHVKIAHLRRPSNDNDANDMYRKFEGCDVLIATPEQVAAAISQKKVSLSNVKVLVIDEMDTILDTKHFEALKLSLAVAQKDVRRRPQRIFVGASFPRDIRNALVSNLMHKNHRLILANMNRSDLYSDVHTGSGNTNISHTIFMLSRMEKIDKIKWLYDTGKCTADQRTIIFCNSINTIKTVMEQLRPALAIHNVNPMMVHSQLSGEAQRVAMRAFTAGATTCLICSDICSTGIDFQKVMYVVNFDMPEEFENWVNRVGRTGRMGQRGYSYSFFAPENIRLAKPLYNYLRSLGQVVPTKLQEYARQGFVNSLGKGTLFTKGKRMGSHLEEMHAPVFSNGSRYLQLKGSDRGQANTQLHRRPVS